MSILSVKAVSYRYKDGRSQRTILDQVSYGFEEGTFYTILGESGSGKTTFISLIAALDTPNEGVICYRDQNIKDIGLVPYRRRHVGIVFQDYNLIPYMSGIQNVQVAMHISGKQRSASELDELMDLVGIPPEVAKRKVATMSGGEKQRIALVRALVSDAGIIIADEPTGNIDQTNTIKIIDVFQELAHTHHKCVIVVTHSADVAGRSDRILDLDPLTHQVTERAEPSR